MRQIVEKARWLTSDYIEGKAEALLRDYECRYGKVSSPPIPVLGIVERHLDLSIDWCMIPEGPGERILACLVPDTREIRFNETRRDFFDEYFGSEPFTLGHEAGHWVLHAQEVDAIQLSLLDTAPRKEFLCRAQGLNDDNTFEWQAHRFAAALIMPEAMVRDYSKHLNLLDWPALYRMRDDFGVSITALRKRLEVLGLIYLAPNGDLWPSYKDYCGQAKLQ